MGRFRYCLIDFVFSETGQASLGLVNGGVRRQQWCSSYYVGHHEQRTPELPGPCLWEKVGNFPSFKEAIMLKPDENSLEIEHKFYYEIMGKIVPNQEDT